MLSWRLMGEEGEGSYNHLKLKLSCACSIACHTHIPATISIIKFGHPQKPANEKRKSISQETHRHILSNEYVVFFYLFIYLPSSVWLDLFSTGLITCPFLSHKIEGIGLASTSQNSSRFSPSRPTISSSWSVSC